MNGVLLLYKGVAGVTLLSRCHRRLWGGGVGSGSGSGVISSSNVCN